MPRLKRSLALALLLCFFSLSAPPGQAAKPAPPPAHQLLAPQIRLLKALGSPVTVPGYVPKGYELDGLYLQYTHPGPGGGPGYELRYRCFCEGQTACSPCGAQPVVLAAPAGMTFFGFPPPIGSDHSGVFQAWRFGLFADLKQGYYLSDWVGKGPLYFSLVTGSGELGAPSAAALTG